MSRSLGAVFYLHVRVGQDSALGSVTRPVSPPVVVVWASNLLGAEAAQKRVANNKLRRSNFIESPQDSIRQSRKGQSGKSQDSSTLSPQWLASCASCTSLT